MKKKVLFVVHHLTIGGAQKSLITALHYFDYDNYDVTLYVRKNRTALLKYIDERANVIINEDKTHYYRKPRAIILQLLIKLSGLLGRSEKRSVYEKKLSDFILTEPMKYEKKRYFGDREYDIAIAFMHGSSALFVADYVKAKKKIIRYCVSTDELHEIHERIFNDIDSIICVSDGVGEAVSAFYPEHRNKIHVIENIVNRQYVLQSGEEYRVDKSDSQYTICSVGRFSKVKGMDFAVDAAKILKDNGISFRWFLLGDGPEMGSLKEKVRINGLSEEVFFTGMTDNPYPYFKACDIFVLPSREEALANSLLEAYAMGKPVVCTETVCGINNVVDGETGILTEISGKGIADGIMKLINNPELCKKISDNLKKTDYEAEKEKYKEQWRELLEAMI